MPKIPKYVPHECMYCLNYEVRLSCGAYCQKYQMPFPNQMNQDNKPDFKLPGKRTCDEWTGKK